MKQTKLDRECNQAITEMLMICNDRKKLVEWKKTIGADFEKMRHKALAKWKKNV